MLPFMRILIIGCGYVGLRVGAELAGQGHEVTGMRRGATNRAEIEAAGIRHITADITKPETLPPLERYDWVVHCVSSSRGGAEDYNRVYVEGTRNLIKWLAETAPQKLVYTSSTGVYAQKDAAWVDETSVTEPTTTGKVLLETEKLLLEAAAGKIPAIILRVAGIYGPGRTYWLNQLLSGEARLSVEGQRMMNMIHRDDVAGAVIACLRRGEPGRAYNAVDDAPVSQLEFFQWLSARLGRALPPVTAEPEEGKRAVTNKRVSNRRLKQDLRYDFKYPTFREGYEAEIQRLGLAPG